MIQLLFSLLLSSIIPVVYGETAVQTIAPVSFPGDKDIERAHGKPAAFVQVAGSSYTDPVFNTRIRKITDALNTPDLADKGMLPFITQEYSTMSVFNADAGKLLLLHSSYFALYNTTGKILRDLPLEINASSQPRWSRNNPDIFYYLNGNRIKQYDLRTSVSGTIRIFDEYRKISGHGESDISFDGDHLVIAGDGEEIFVYTFSTNSKGPVLNAVDAGEFDNLQITPDNNVLIGWNKAGVDRFSGYELFDKDMNFMRQVTRYLGHADIARDAEGAEVLLWANAADPAAPADCQNGIVKINLGNSEHTCLLTLDWGLATHLSVADLKDWFIVSTYAYSDPGPETNWPKYTNEILQVKLDGSEINRLAHHRSLPLNNYYYQPRASVSRDGKRLVFSSNQGQSSVQGFPENYVDVYMIDLDAVDVNDSVSAVVSSPSPDSRRNP